MTNRKLTQLLPKATREKFQVVDIPKGSKRMHFGAFGTIDFSELTEKRAQRLISSGFKKLAPAPKPKKEENKAGKGDK